MSTLSGLNSAIRSIQTGHVSSQIDGNSTSPDLSYKDITITSVTPGKCVVILDMLLSTNDYGYVDSGSLSSSVSYLVTGRLTGATTLRLSANRVVASSFYFVGRYQIVEYY